MSTLILITDKYPQGNGEAFVADEIKHSSLFEKIIVIPIGVYEENDVRSTVSSKEEDVFMSLTRLSNYQKFSCFFTAIISKVVWQEIIYLFVSQKLSVTNVSFLLSTYSYGIVRSRQVINTLSRMQFDKTDTIVQSYWLHNTAFVAISIAKKYQLSVVSRCHRCDVYENENKYAYIPLRSYLLNNLDKVFCISQDAISYLKRTYPLYKDKYCLSRLGSSDYGVSKWHDSKTIRIISVSYLNPIKRVSLIVDTLKGISDLSILWVHYGTGTEEKKIKDAAAVSLDVLDNVKYHFMGLKEHSALMHDYLEHEFDLFVNVSESEGVPVSIMEALSFGIPVVATDVGGTSEIVHDGENGWILPANFAVAQLADIIYCYSKLSTSERKKLRINARNLWEYEASADKQYRKHEQEIRGMINAKKRK